MLWNSKCNGRFNCEMYEFLWWFHFSHFRFSLFAKLLFTFLHTQICSHTSNRHTFIFFIGLIAILLLHFVFSLYFLCTHTLAHTVSILVIIATCALAQNYQYNTFNGCDYYENIELNRVYDVFSPFYPGKYPPGTNCRWSGCAPYGTNIVIKCTDMAIPTVIMNDSIK